jgi:myo-inositol catabolism protein IolC
MTMTLGYDKPLYILPFDHRASFSKELFGWHGELSPAQTAEIAASKRVIFDAIRTAVVAGVPKQRAGILVDEQFGAAILRDARAEGLTTACPAEKSGHDEFDFEYGSDFARHIEQFDPTFCKVLVRYNGSYRTTCTHTADCTCSNCLCPRSRPSSSALGTTRTPTTSSCGRH